MTATWWNDSYLFRRNLSVVNSTRATAEADHYVSVPFLASKLVTAGKALESYEDIEVIYQTDDATPTYTVLSREITETHINFYLVDDLTPADASQNYFAYYGNFDLVDIPERPEFEEQLWSVTKEHDDQDFTYTRPGEHWQDGVSAATNATATVRTYGSRLRVISNVDVNQGIMEVSVDDGEWQDVDLHSSDSGETVVYETDELSATRHRVQIRVSGRRNPSSSNDTINIESVEYQIPLVATDSGEEIKELTWSSIMSGA